MLIFYSCSSTGSNVTADDAEAITENNHLASEKKQEEFEKINLPDFEEVQTDNEESETLDILPKVVKPYSQVTLPSPIVSEKELSVMDQSPDLIPFSLQSEPEIPEPEPKPEPEPEPKPESTEQNRVAETLLPREAPIRQQPKEEEPDKVVYYEENAKTVEIELDRMGWIYVGEKTLTEKPSESSATLESRRLVPEKSSTIFTFRLNGEGPFRLAFQLQDMEGGSEISDIALEPSPNVAELEVMPALQPEEVAASTSEEEPDISSESPKELSPQDITSSIDTAEKLANAGQHSAAITLLEAALKSNPLMAEKDKLYYLLGKFYEAEGEKRNPEKAVYYYKKLIDDYPLSTYYDKAEVRSIYVRKHFLYIR